MAATHDVLENALILLGDLLASRQQHFEVVAIGGGSLLLMGLLTRPTRDIDLVAVVHPNGAYVSAEPLPSPLALASAEVGAALGIGKDWFNSGPTALLMFGLPAGFHERLITRQFNGPTVHLASRRDQICFKLYAAVDQGPDSKHFADLCSLLPTHEELVFAAQWSLTHDMSPEFAHSLRQALTALGVPDDNRE